MVKNKAAGVIIKARDTGKVLLLLRSNKVETPMVWGMVSGGVEHYENILNGLRREIMEETKVNPSIIDFEYVEKIDNGDKDFYLYKGSVDKEFTPTLCDENIDWGWFKSDDLPDKLYPNLDKLIIKHG